MPEHPEGASFNPNEIKDIQVADPGSSVNLIEPPTANNQGEARLTYPIEVPPGRTRSSRRWPSGTARPVGTAGSASAGICPLASRRHPDGASRVTTRRRDRDLPDRRGELLHPPTGRSRRHAPRKRSSTPESRASSAGSSGTAPARRTTGGRSPTRTAPDPSTVVTRTRARRTQDKLADEHGDISAWALREMRDPNDNSVRYHYVRVSDAGVAGGTCPASAIPAADHLHRLRARPRASTRSPSSGTGTAARRVVRTSRSTRAYGFKKVTAELLRRIVVYLGDQTVRGYELNYRAGAFDKTLLSSVTQFGADGTPFNTHTFELLRRHPGLRAGDYDAFGRRPMVGPARRLGAAAAPVRPRRVRCPASTTHQRGRPSLRRLQPDCPASTGRQAPRSASTRLVRRPARADRRQRRRPAGQGLPLRRQDLLSPEPVRAERPAGLR